GLAGINSVALLPSSGTGPALVAVDVAPVVKETIYVDAGKGPELPPFSITPLPPQPPSPKPPGERLSASALLLVLHTKTLKLNDSPLNPGLEELEQKHGQKLLGRHVYLLTPKGARPLDDNRPANREAFENSDFVKMFEQAFREVETLAGRAENSKFQV